MAHSNKNYIGNPLGFFNDNLEKMQAGGTKGSWEKGTNKKTRNKHTKKTCSRKTWRNSKNCRKK